MVVLGFLAASAEPVVAAHWPMMSPTSMGGGIGPIADWTGDIEDETDENKNLLDTAVAGLNGYGRDPSDPQRVQLAALLDQAEAIMTRVLDPGQYPSLEPPDAGHVEIIRTGDLFGVAMTCCFQAADALAAAQVGGPEMSEVIGTKFRTTLALLPVYRERAGIIDPDD